ncbi:MAG: acyl-CoA thioesterase [Spirochaetales bacterium]|nr:acyl-CoA thioesterase [Spirochaetales bacterium]
MDTFTLVRPEYLNHFGYLFGGQLLKWVDELAWLFVTREYPDKMFVTRAMNNIDFKTKVKSGSILRFHIHVVKRGKSSLTCCVEVFAQYPGTKKEIFVFSNDVTFVNIDKNGHKSIL